MQNAGFPTQRPLCGRPHGLVLNLTAEPLVVSIPPGTVPSELNFISLRIESSA